MKKKSILILLILISWKGISCECFSMKIKQLDSISLQQSDLVIIGKIVEFNNSDYTIEVQQILRGSSNSKTIKGIYSDDPKYEINSCAFYPRKKDIYLLYLSKVKSKNEDFYFSSECWSNRTINGSILPFADIDMNKKELKEWTEHWINKICAE